MLNIATVVRFFFARYVASSPNDKATPWFSSFKPECSWLFGQGLRDVLPGEMVLGKISQEGIDNPSCIMINLLLRY
jgi:hypothetical protein